MRFRVLLMCALILGCAKARHDAAPTVGPEIPDPTAGPKIPYTIDPCGDGPGQDEILLVLEGPAYVRTVKGRFVELRPGTYRTKDRQKCKFKILNGGGYLEI